MIEIFVDRRERGFLTYIGDLGEVRVVQLEIGDYIIRTGANAIAIERKTLGDFISSFRNGRLWEQLVALSKMKEYEGSEVVRRMLVIERSQGDDEILDEKGWASVIGAQMECIYTYHIPIVQVRGDQGIGSFLRVLVRREWEGLNDRVPPARWFKPRTSSDLPVKDQRVLFLSMIPGVGDKLAFSLLERFGSIENLSRASVKDLQSVSGIGEKKAKGIFGFLH
jgi:DNA excision repair protein ERCC-4